MEKKKTTCMAGAVSELLETAGNCRQNTNQGRNFHLLSDSVFSEQQKLRYVLDWANRFLSSGSEVYTEFCSADSLLLAAENDEKKRGTEEGSPSYKHPFSAKYYQLVSSTTGSNEAFEGGGTGNVGRRDYPSLQNDLDNLFTLIPERDEETRPENREANERHQTNISNMLASSSATYLIKESTSCWSNIIHEKITVPHAVSTLKPLLKGSDSTDMIHNSAGAQSKGEMSVNQEELRDKVERMVEEKIDASLEENDGKMCTNHKFSSVSHSEPEKIPRQMAETANHNFTSHLKIPTHLTVYDWYQLCVDQLHHHSMRKSQHIEPGCLVESYEDERTTCEDVAAPAEAPAPPTSFFEFNYPSTNPEIKKHLNKTRNKSVTAAGVTDERSSAQHCDNLTVKERCLCKKSPVIGSNWDFIKRTAEAIRSTVLLPDKAEHHPSPKSLQRGVKGQKNMRKHTSPCRESHTCLQAVQTHILHLDGTRPTSPISGTTVPGVVNITVCKYSPGSVAVHDQWLCLPDEVWLSILSLLPHSNLCRVAQVCSHLYTLTADHTLWKNLEVENATLTERRLLFVGKRRPRSLCLHSCSSLSITSFGLEMFFTLCHNSLEEIKITSCTGPGLHGDQMLPLISQLCDHVISVDVSWSGATDTGVRALSEGYAGSRLESVVLNGCHVTDDPLKKLVMRHKESLCRLEVFGCQFLTPSCLQTIYEMCPGLKHLNIGQVPKVNAHSLTVMTSHLKCLISLNLTGLQAVTDATMDILLQNCVKLQSLTLSSCPGITDLTLHNISKYTPCIRSLDLSSCKAVTDAGVQCLSLGCNRLQQLNLSSTGTGNRGVTLLANYCSGHLHTVKLSFCHVISENILKLCRHCKRLKVLHVYGCAHLPTEREIREVNPVVKVYPLP